MDKKTVFVKTEIGENEAQGKSDALYGDAKRVLSLVDDKSTVAEITKRAPPSLRDTLQNVLQELVDGGYVRDMSAPDDEPKKSALKFSTPAFKMSKPQTSPPVVANPRTMTSTQSRPESLVSKPDNKESAQTSNSGDLDFSFIQSESSKGKNEIEVQSQTTQAQARQEAATKAARLKAYEDAKVKAQIEVAMRAKIEGEARAKKEAEARALKEADESRLKAEREALKIRKESELAKARIEAEIRTRLEAEAKIKREAETIRIKAEEEAEKLRLELEAAKVKAEIELRNRLEAEARAKAEFEARLKREAEAERLKFEKERAELEMARIKAEAELKMREEAEIRVRAAMEARLKADALARQTEDKLKQDALSGAGSKPASVKHQTDPGEKLRQSFVDSSGQNNKKQDASTGSFKLEQFSLLDTGKIAAYAGESFNPGSLSGGVFKVNEVLEANARKEAEETSIKNERVSAQARQEHEKAVQAKAQQDEAAARARAEQESIRLKAEHEAYRLKIQQDEERAKADIEARKLADQQSKQWEDAQQRAAILAQAEKNRLAQEVAEAEARLKQKNARIPRKSVPVGKIFSGLIFLILVAVVGLPYIWPLDEYIAPLEAEITAQIRQPVHIKKINFSLLPLPKLELYSVSVGKSEEMKAGNVEMNFDISALFASTKSINELKFHNVVLAGSSLDTVLAWLQAIGATEKYPIAHMEFKGLRINSDQIKLPSLNGRANFNAQGKFTHANLNSEDGKLGIELQLQQNRLQLEISLHDNSLPLFENVKFNDMSVTATVANGEAVLSDFFAHIHGGTLTGKGRLIWSNGWKLQGQVNARNVDLHQVFPNFGLTGELLGDINIQLASSTLVQFGNSLNIEGSFSAKNGVISKIDIETVARFGARPGVAGHTNFNELTGTIKADSNGQRVYLSKLESAAANTSGLIDVDAKQQLSGKLQVDIKGLGAGSIPLHLTGTTTDPILQSGR